MSASVHERRFLPQPTLSAWAPQRGPDEVEQVLIILRSVVAPRDSSFKTANSECALSIDHCGAIMPATLALVAAFRFGRH